MNPIYLAFKYFQNLSREGMRLLCLAKMTVSYYFQILIDLVLALILALGRIVAIPVFD